MQYNSLGGSGLKVSKICLGTNMFGAEYVDDSRALSVMNTAAEQGINFIDTADMYNDGRSEEVVGRGVRGRRQEFVIATMWYSRMGLGPNDQGSSRKHLRAAVEASLRRLDTDYIDLYLLHFWDPDTPLEESLQALDEMVTEGKIRYLGCCNFSGWQLSEAVWIARDRGIAQFVVIQPEYNFARRDIEKDIFPLAERYGIGVTPYQLLMGGMLTGSYTLGKEPPADSHMATRHAGAARQKYWSEACFKLVAEVKELAESCGLTPVQIALAWAASRSPVSSVIVGASRPSQLIQNAEAAAIILPGEVLEELDRFTV